MNKCTLFIFKVVTGVQGRAMEGGQPVYREFGLDELVSRARLGEIAIETKRYKLNGREIVAGEGGGVASFTAGGDYGTLETHDGKLILRTQVRGEAAEVEIEPQDVRMVTLL